MSFKIKQCVLRKLPHPCLPFLNPEQVTSLFTTKNKNKNTLPRWFYSIMQGNMNLFAMLFIFSNTKKWLVSLK